MRLAEAEEKCKAVQRMVFEKVHPGKAVNSYEVEEEGRKVTRGDGATGICDVSYNSSMPNGFLDIWYPNEDHGAKRPTIVHFHGGGFLFGDKGLGDPLAVKSDSKKDMAGVLLGEGYNFVTANYAFAPEYRFPSQLVQVKEVFAFLKEHGAEYGLDMSRVIMAGGSAGAVLTQIYALAVADEEYAKEIGIVPAITPEELKCVVINEAALITEAIANSASKTCDNMICLIQNWLGTDDFLGSRQAGLVNVAAHIRGAYPPAFLIASNEEDFFEADAAAMDAALTRFGLPHEHYYRGIEVELLSHGFINQFETSACAKECLDKALAFMRRHVGVRE
ncbi:MAG: alpha/beta hydrolase [Ruminococcus sp.]|nr:alpha/beta hydrolase [Ruminococcus sp.]